MLQRAVVSILVSLAVTGTAAFAAGVWGIANGKATERAHWQGVVQGMLARAAEVAERHRKDVADVETRWRAAYNSAAQQGAQERERAQRIARELAAARAERNGLRAQIDAYATADCADATGAHAAACARAATLGVLLDESMRVQEELAGAAESHATGVRELRGAWPQ